MTTKNLPEWCYVDDHQGHVAIATNRKTGLVYPDRTIELSELDTKNDQLGITKGQSNAMYHGATCGWSTFGADPSLYDVHGQYIPAAQYT